MSILAWIVLGLIAGFIASKIYVGTGQGILMDIVLGIVGAVVGGYLFDMIGADRHHRIQHLEHAGRDRRRRVGAVDLSHRQRPQRVTSRSKFEGAVLHLAHRPFFYCSDGVGGGVSSAGPPGPSSGPGPAP